jgi:hypothetical protein
MKTSTPLAFMPTPTIQQQLDAAYARMEILLDQREQTIAFLRLLNQEHDSTKSKYNKAFLDLCDTYSV